MASQYQQKKQSLIGKVMDKVTGTSRIDNSTDPSSALSMLRRKAAARATNTKQAPVGRGSNGIGVGGI